MPTPSSPNVRKEATMTESEFNDAIAGINALLNDIQRRINQITGVTSSIFRKASPKKQYHELNGGVD